MENDKLTENIYHLDYWKLYLHQMEEAFNILSQVWSCIVIQTSFEEAEFVNTHIKGTYYNHITNLLCR